MKKYTIAILVIILMIIGYLHYSNIFLVAKNNNIITKMFGVNCKYTSKSLNGFNNIKNLTISKDGNTIAFASKEGNKYYLYLNYIKIGKGYFDITNISLNYNGKAYAYTGIDEDIKTKQRKWKLIINGIEDDMSKFSLVGDFVFSNDGKRFMYILSPNFKDFYVINEKNNEFGPYEIVSDKQYSKDSTISLFKARKTDGSWIYSNNGKESNKYEAINGIFFGEKSGYLYIIGNKEGKEILEKNGKNISFIQQDESPILKYNNEYLQNGKVRLIYNNKYSPEFDKIEPYYIDKSIRFIGIKNNLLLNYTCPIKN